MAEWFLCHKCQKVSPIMSDLKKCSSCGSDYGDVLSPKQFEKMRQAEAIFDLAGKKKKMKK